MYKKALASLLVVLTLGLLFVSVPQAKANPQFIIASWAYPDEYGQGIYQIRVNENSTGSWALVDVRTYEEAQIYQWNASVAIQLYVWLWLNSTLTGASSLTDGRNYQRCNVTVTSLGETIFSQNNFTFQDENDYADMYLYEYNVILNFVPLQGTLYTVTVTYEIWW